jgi:threonine dehydratase
MKITIDEIRTAHNILKKYIQPSPLLKNEWLSKKYHCNVYLKLENMLPVGSFKLRGATYKLSQLPVSELTNGVLAVSAGNHAQGVAWAASLFKTKAKIIMPLGSPITKIANTQALGAEVILHGENVEEGFEYAKILQKKENLTFIHPFEDEMIIAGQGTLALEVLESLPQTDYVFGSIGGGGLLAGVGTVFKELSAQTVVVGAQASGASSMVESLQKSELIEHPTASTFADGIKVKKTSATMFALLDKVVDEALHLSDDRIALSLLELMEHARIIAEGAGALPLAAFDELYQKNPRRFKGKNIVLIICGGNIDINVIDRIIERGLIASHRRVNIKVPLADKPGTLKLLTQILFEQGANILQAIHDREAPSLELQESLVDLTLEIKGKDHLDQIVSELNKHFKHVQIVK